VPGRRARGVSAVSRRAGWVPPAAGPPRPSLAWRITGSCLLVAAVAVGVAGLVSLRLVGTTVRAVSSQVLAQQADVIAAQFADAGPAALLGQLRVAQVLRGQGVSVVVVSGTGALLTDDPVARDAATAAGVAGVVGGGPVSAAVRVGARDELVEARPALGGGFALVRAALPEPLPRTGVGRNIGAAMLAGGLAAVVVGFWLSRLLARPLRRTVQVARRMREGHRDDRIPVEGPEEVAEVAQVVNELADALAYSEGRQREFLLSVSHELRTPLTAITGFAESLADGVVTGDAVPAAGRTIGGEAQRLTRLVNDLLELARVGADDFTLQVAPVELGALLGEAAEVWSARCAAGGARLVRDVPAAPVCVRTDPRRLRQVLDALAENAVRLLPTGAPLVFALRPGRDGGAVLEVRDGGPGLAPADYDVAFQRGRLHERYQGRRATGSGGIGLALVHGLVTRLGGTIVVGPADEGGARFTITLPAAPPS
jgi:two-component system, OmpR family, sensor kinase